MLVLIAIHSYVFQRLGQVIQHLATNPLVKHAITSVGFQEIRIVNVSGSFAIARRFITELFKGAASKKNAGVSNGVLIYSGAFEAGAGCNETVPSIFHHFQRAV